MDVSPAVETITESPQLLDGSQQGQDSVFKFDEDLILLKPEVDELFEEYVHAIHGKTPVK